MSERNVFMPGQRKPSAKQGGTKFNALPMIFVNTYQTSRDLLLQWFQAREHKQECPQNWSPSPCRSLSPLPSVFFDSPTAARASLSLFSFRVVIAGRRLGCLTLRHIRKRFRWQRGGTWRPGKTNSLLELLRWRNLRNVFDKWKEEMYEIFK